MLLRTSTFAFLILFSGAFGASLVAEPVGPLSAIDPETLKLLSDALVSDLQSGDIGNAQAHVIQLEIAIMASRQAAQVAGDNSSAKPQLPSLQSQFLNSLNIHPPSAVLNDASRTSGMIYRARLLSGPVQAGNFDEASTEIRSLITDIAKTNAELLSSRLTDRIEGISDPVEREFMIATKALSDALVRDDVFTAEALAPEVLRQTEDLRSELAGNSLLGTNIYNGYDALGRAAFARGDYAAANEFLLKAATTPGTGFMAKWGPNLKLADALLGKGQDGSVVNFLTACKNLWSSELLDEWITQIRAGQRPDFSRNLRQATR